MSDTTERPERSGPLSDGIVRRASPEDAEGIGAIHVSAWRVAYRDLLPAAILDGLDVRARTEGWRRGLAHPSHRIYVARRGKEVLGFVSLGPSRDEDQAKVCEMTTLYVAPDHWRQGFGSRLCQAAIAAATALGYGQLTLWVLDTNTRAVAFYRRHGFREDGGVRRDEVAAGYRIREIRMRRFLVASRTSPSETVA
ncbi:MAG: GNAT family N-acetyltransferase [Opitutaceae bacterium]